MTVPFPFAFPFYLVAVVAMCRATLNTILHIACPVWKSFLTIQGPVMSIEVLPRYASMPDLCLILKSSTKRRLTPFGGRGKTPLTTTEALRPLVLKLD